MFVPNEDFGSEPYQPDHEELGRFRAEAEVLLEIKPEPESDSTPEFPQAPDQETSSDENLSPVRGESE